MMSRTTWSGAGKLVDHARVVRFGSWYVAEYRIRNMAKWWTAIFVFGLGTPLLYLASIGIGVGALVDKNVGSAGVSGVGYLVFLAPALLVSASIQGTMDEVTFPTLHGFLWAKIFYGMNSTGITGQQIARGVLLSAMVRSVITVGIYWLVLLFAGAFENSYSWLAIPFSIFAGGCFGAFMLAVSGLIKNDDGYFAIIGRFIIAPMFLFSGTFYPLTSLPIYIQWIGWISPLWHATEICRWLTFDYDLSLNSILMHFGYLSFLGVAGIFFAQRIFTKRLAL
jgi:lipooligosaccharide transport system permease protein